MNKEQLTKLALLDNPKTLKFLIDFALVEKTKIINAKSNEEIIEHLDILNTIYYRIPKITVWVIEHFLYKAKSLDTIYQKTTFGNFPGKTHEEVLVKCLEIARNIRYYELKKCLKISYDYISHTDKNVVGMATKLLEEIVEYNQQALNKIGIIPQLESIKFLEKIDTKKYREKDVLFAKIILKNILETSLSHTAVMTSPDTLTFSSGDIGGHPNIAKIRSKAIDLSFKIFQTNKSIKIKTDIFNLFEQACHMPIHSSRKDSLGLIVQKDRIYILKKLNSLTFRDKKIIQPFSICIQIQRLLFWSFIHIELQEKPAMVFIKRFYSNDQYKLFNKFVHDDRYRYSKNKIQEIDVDPRKNIDSYVSNISEDNQEEILSELEKIAKEAKNVDEWKFFSFKQLLEAIGQQKPDIAIGFILKIVSQKYELANSYFLPFLLAGLRRADRFDLWDKASEVIFKRKNQETLLALISSFYMSHSVETDILVRKKEDIDLLENFISRKRQFTFYKKNNNLIKYSTINALRVAFRFDPKRIEKLTILELKNNPDYFLGYLHGITLYSKENEGFYLNNWSKGNKKFLLKKLIELHNIDWNIEAILPLIANQKEIIDFFIDRIKFKEKHLSENNSDYFTSPYRSYDPVPYHMNEKLIDFIKSDKEIVGIITKYISAKYSSYSFELSQFIKNLRINSRDIFKQLQKESKDVGTLLKRMIMSLSSFDQNDPDFLVELAGMTSDKKIHRELYGRLSSIGVVSGEFGIADAYKHKREVIEKYKDNKNKNVRDFVLMAIKSLSLSEEHQRKETEQEKEIRRVDFESSS
jgi:hypothetical protein